jgi:hypothetical protein
VSEFVHASQQQEIDELKLKWQNEKQTEANSGFSLLCVNDFHPASSDERRDSSPGPV